MKKFLACAVVLLPVVATAATGGAGAGHPVYINGKHFSNAVDVNGTLAVPLADLSKSVGANVSLEPAFQLQGNMLKARAGWDIKKNVKANSASASESKIKFNDISISHTYDKASPLLFRVNKEGSITNHVLTLNGQAMVPLSDVARAFGGVWTQPAGGLAPGAAIQLNFTSNPNAILVGL